MISNPDISMPRLHPIPRGKPRRWWIFPQPVPAGFYGVVWSGSLWVTTNHLPAIAAKSQTDQLILAVEAGGMYPTLAAAFDPGIIEDARRQVEALTRHLDVAKVEVDPALARRLKMEIGEINGLKKCTVSSAPNADRLQIGTRILGALMMALGQAVIVALPLLLFGWQNLVIGLTIIFCAALVMSILWPLPRRKCLPCRLALSIISTLLACLFAWLVLNLPVERLTWLAGGWWMVSFWMSFVFMGVKT